MVQQTINLYAWRENEKMIPPVLITQGESDTRTATFRLLDQATTIDLTGKSISFEYDKPDGFHVSLVCQPTENPGECTCTFSDQAAIAPGIVNDTRVMVRSGTDVLEILGPRLYIANGINANAIVSSSEFATLSAYISDLSTYYQQVAAVQSGLQTTNQNLTSLQGTVTGIEGDISSLQSTDTQLQQSITTVSGNLTTHTSNSTIHVTQEEKTQWNENSIVSGLVLMWPGSTPPDGWLLCNGQAVSRTTYANLFSVLGTTYGQGDGSTTFNVPDLTGRVPMGTNGTYPLASKGGETAHTLSEAELPAVNGYLEFHNIYTGTNLADVKNAFSGQKIDGKYRDGGSTQTGASSYVVVNLDFGQDAAHNNMQPYLAQNYIIKY